MGAILAAALAVLVLAGGAVPHEHVRPHAAQSCMACAVGQTSAARDETPDVAPARVVSSPPAADPGPAPVAGAPLGAVPGQSPPSLA